MNNGTVVKDWTSGRTGVVIDSGWSWQTVRFDDGITEEVAGWTLED